MRPSSKRISYLEMLLVLAPLLAITLVPVWSVDLAPLQDYHNHLARQHILVDLPRSDELAQHYQSEWVATPYLAMDAVVQILAEFFPVETAAKIFLSLTLILLALAPISLNASLFGQVTPIALLGLLFVNSHTLQLGFVQYLFSVGFAICLLALWIHQRHRNLAIRLIVFPVLSCLLFYSHLMGFLIYGLTVSAYELGRHTDQVRHRTPHRPFFFDTTQRWKLISLSLQLLFPLALFGLYGPVAEAVDSANETSYGGISRKIDLISNAFSYLITPYLWSLDRVLAFVLPLALLLLLVAGKLRIAKYMQWPLIIMAVLFLAMPMQWLGGWGRDHRLLPAIALLFVGSTCLKAAVSRRLCFALIAALVITRAAAVTADWREADLEHAEYKHSFQLLKAGSKVYFGTCFEANYTRGRRSTVMLPTLAVAQKHVYVPHLFTASEVPGLPLQYKSGYPRIDTKGVNAPFLSYGSTPDWAQIGDSFDYVILSSEKFCKTPVPSHFRTVYKSERFSIYRADSAIAAD